MTNQFTPELMALGQYLAGEFENRQQALASPAWFVHLRLWLRPVPLFREDSITLFAEQASLVNLDQPYRPRLWRLRQISGSSVALQVEHYKFKDIKEVQGAGRNREILQQISLEQIEPLTTPGCTLKVEINPIAVKDQYHFKAFSESESPCEFTYEGQDFQVALGFEVNSQELKTYDKGIDPNTGRAIWGALMGAYCYQKQVDFSGEINLF
ncbi:protein of unknown function DUF1001 [Gloeothece citriformis PCC 7424]|uniref:Chromophore lyase CpcT/CpeT n=1 Tax=Gloeothece citriformis (strain PCC 7424) TaxID=65393 RepID=B7KI39_GLOC7|nr:chromophore lyase CpcT/CpeT [Gloeothece citriformis]ACK73526.1 protein of unknown function DUF1001 [Gloeothece citriformis PCC 7424]